MTKSTDTQELELGEIPLPIKYPVHYSELGTYIYDADNNMIADVRGWGWIQYMDNPEAIQDNMGKFIADAINEKLDQIKSALGLEEEK